MYSPNQDRPEKTNFTLINEANGGHIGVSTKPTVVLVLPTLVEEVLLVSNFNTWPVQVADNNIRREQKSSTHYT